jgi:FkbM family methyltransferase
MQIEYPQDYISQTLISSGEYEWYVIEIIKSLCSKHNQGIFLDIGANQGTVTLPIARDFSNYVVHSFEIQPAMLGCLKQNIKLNNLSNVVVHEHGLGEVDNTVTVAQPDYARTENIGAFSLNPIVWKNSAISQGHGDPIQVKIITLDSCQFDLPIRCIKLDVEGFEAMVLRGAFQTLRKHNYPPIVYELWNYNPWWHEHAREIEYMLTQMGYQIQKIDDTGIAQHL